MTLYLVRRRRNDAAFDPPRWDRMSEPIRAFPTRAAAEALRAALDADFRARYPAVNPFAERPRDGQTTDQPWETPPWEELSRLPPGAMCDWLIEGGVEPPPFRFGVDGVADIADMATWMWWWYECEEQWSPEQRDRVWQGFDRFGFHDVVAVPLEGTP